MSSPAPALPSLALRWLRATPSLKSLALRSAYLRSELEADDVAAAVAYLASDDAKFIPGVELPIDGGLLAQ